MDADAAEDSERTLVFRRSDFDDGTRGELPEDLRIRIPAVRLVRQVEEIAGRLAASRSANAAAPHLAAVLLWCLVTGRYGSWDIEALCEEEPLCRHLAGPISLTRADIHRYRREQEAPLQLALTEILSAAAPDSKITALTAEAARRLDRARQADREGPV